MAPPREPDGPALCRDPGSVLAGQHEHRNLSRGPGLVFADGRRLRDQLRPQPGAGGVVQLLRQYRERLGTHLDVDPGVALRLSYQSGWVGDPPLAATIAQRPSP
jgi:hypothetical protein